ncbi:serine/threonine-protein kinase M1 [Puccinia graminis f. sp. tritici]|uniref:Serine/threonine-protein kinase M1 n=1 Tax=Puccinia graminis f. sp. tritici TaxID=56615 RepID=A0A5B0PXU8_PUCGR|nr:serine/threonine-protein kinase M1 [Puccinia graminis f. sp. tritici]
MAGKAHPRRLERLPSSRRGMYLAGWKPLAISIVHRFELTRATDLELVDQGRVKLDKSLGHRICTILLRQMCRRCTYLLGVIKTEFDSYGSALFADLLGISLEIFLTSTARSTLPLLVLNSNTTTIEAIAKAKEETVPGLLVYQAADILTELCSRNTTKELKKGAEIFYRLLNSGRKNPSDPNQISIQIGKLMEMSAGLIYY